MKCRKDFNTRMLTTPNGGLAILDKENKLIAYCKIKPNRVEIWDWVRADYRLRDRK